MKKVECLVCRSTETKQLNYTPSYGNYILMHCVECGLKFMLSENFKVLNDDTYWDDVNKEIYTMPVVLEEFRKKHNKYLKLIIKNTPPNKKLLDVGCGSGIFLTAAKKNDFDATGIEPSQIAVELCQNRHRIFPYHGYLKIDSSLPKKYGILTAWDVIEHVAKPDEFLEACHAHLDQGGLLLLETPDESSVIRKIINIIDSMKRALGLDASSSIYYPSHRNYFTHKSIKKLLYDRGFSNIKIYKEHTMYAKAKAKYKLYRKYSSIQMVKYDILFFILKFQIFWNKQVILCTKM